MTIRSLRQDDLDSVAAINQLNVGDVGPISDHQLALVLSSSRMAFAVENDEGNVVGFALIIDAACGHLTPRAEWALQAGAADLHLERVAFDMTYSGQGLGLALYDEIDARILEVAAGVGAGTTTLSSLVCLDPPNQHSIGFHSSRGFDVLDRATFDNTTIGVACKTYVV
ncbi:GNAT family N-acetyltransferase [Candidatus Poriferisocius sp.]|uniref:GNAT family N-acetyltransferase n=1 Tax=Candidatus Poriferisocius sp. TaxID=3101276 RepID=UPI003B5ADD3D